MHRVVTMTRKLEDIIINSNGSVNIENYFLINLAKFSYTFVVILSTKLIIKS